MIQQQTPTMADLFGEPIYTYTRAQAIEDGELVDVSQMAREAGFKFPMCVTRAVWRHIEAIPESRSHQDVNGRLWDVLHMAYVYIARNTTGAGQILFRLILDRNGTRQRYILLKVVGGAGDDGEPVMTIMLPEES